MNYVFLRSVKTLPNATSTVIDAGRAAYQAARHRLRNLGLQAAYQMLDAEEPTLIHSVSFWQEAYQIDNMASNSDRRYQHLAQQPIEYQQFATYKLIKAYARDHLETRFNFLILLTIKPQPHDAIDYAARLLASVVEVGQMPGISSLWFGANVASPLEYLGFVSWSEEDLLRTFANTYAYPFNEYLGPAAQIKLTASNLSLLYTLEPLE